MRASSSALDRRLSKGWLTCVALGALAVAAGSAVAPADAGTDGTATLTVSSTAIKGQAGNKLIVLAKGDGSAARLCVTIPSDDYSLPPTALSEPPIPWNPCGPETPPAALTEGSFHLRAMVNVPDTRTPLVLVEQEITVSGDATIQLDGSSLSAEAD